MKTTAASVIAAACLVFCLSARAQAGPTWFTVDGGGGTSRGGQFTLAGTIGQPDAGRLSGGPFVVQGGFWSGVRVLQTTGAPLLKIKLVGANAILSWPIAASGFNLEETTALNVAAWNPTPQPIVDTVTEHTVTVPAVGVIKLFRLKK